MANELTDARDDTLTAPDVMRDLNEYRDAVAAATAVTPERWADSYDTARYGRPSETILRVRGELADVMTGLVAAAEPGYIYGTDHGRINPHKWANPGPGPRDVSTLFDLYDPGAMDDVSTSVVVILDQSGSMGHRAGELSETLWAMAHIARAGDIDLTVIGFGAPGDTVTLFDDTDPTPGDRVRLIDANGSSTDPRDALRFAAAKLTDPDAGTNRAMLIMTDGQIDWSARDETARLIRGMANEGIATGSYFLGGGDPVIGADYARVSFELTELPELMAEMVLDQMARFA